MRFQIKMNSGESSAFGFKYSHKIEALNVFYTQRKPFMVKTSNNEKEWIQNLTRLKRNIWLRGKERNTVRNWKIPIYFPPSRRVKNWTRMRDLKVKSLHFAFVPFSHPLELFPFMRFFFKVWTVKNDIGTELPLIQIILEFTNWNSLRGVCSSNSSLVTV